MKFAWRTKVEDLAASNSEEVEEVDLDEYSEMLVVDESAAEFDKLEDDSEFVLID
jgi:hypothetical protein